MIRAFIAMHLPEALRREIASLQANLRSSAADVRWVEPENMHLTLKFLGSVEEGDLVLLEEALHAAVRPFAPFFFQLEGIGTFPRTAQPRVVWLAVSQGKDQLVEIAQAVEQACVEVGLPAQERSFSPHLTLGRIRSNKGLDPLLRRLKSVQIQRLPLAQVKSLTLFQSTLSPDGPTYTPLAEIPLGG